jgi:hypothetical protein
MRRKPKTIHLGNKGSIKIKHPGALHAKLGVPQDQDIPSEKLEGAMDSDDPTLRRQANLANTMKGWKKK